MNQAQPHSISISISIQAMEFYILFAIFFRYFIPRDGRCGWIVEMEIVEMNRRFEFLLGDGELRYCHARILIPPMLFFPFPPPPTSNLPSLPIPSSSSSPLLSHSPIIPPSLHPPIPPSPLSPPRPIPVNSPDINPHTPTNLHPVVQPIYKQKKNPLPLSLLRAEAWAWAWGFWF